MNQSKPRVTVGVPVYNGERYLREAVACLQAQTLPDIEILIADNASTDDTHALSVALAREDDRITVLSAAENRGAAWNFNRLVGAARAPYFAWHAVDDLREPEFLERCVAALDSDPGAVLAHTQVLDIDSQREVFHEWGPHPRATDPSQVARFADVLFNELEAFPVFGVIRTDVLRRSQIIGSYTGSDWVLLAELALHGRFVEIPEPLFLHREHDERSVRAYPNHYDRVAWFDTSRAGKASLPRWSIGLGHYRSVVRTPLPITDRLRCGRFVSAWLWPQRRRLAKELIAAARTTIKK